MGPIPTVARAVSAERGGHSTVVLKWTDGLQAACKQPSVDCQEMAAVEPLGIDTNDPLALLRYLQKQGKIATDDHDDDESDGAEERGGDNHPSASNGEGIGGIGDSTDVPQTPQEQQDALLKYMSQRMTLLTSPPLVHAEPIPTDADPDKDDSVKAIVEGRLDKDMWSNFDADGRSTAELLREVKLACPSQC